MKYRFLSLLLIVVTVMVSAQELTTTDAVLVYYMPKTQLAFDVEFTETTRTQGPFYQYAERYLGTKEIVMSDEHVFELTDIQMRTLTVADKDRAFTFKPSTAQRARIVLDKNSVLAAYNVEETASEPAKKDPTKKESKNREAMPAPNALSPSLAPLSEEALFASSKAKMAEAAAKQIYRLREARLNLLTGEVEHMPADSKMLNAMLEQLEAQEAQLTALFVGTTRQVKHRKTVYYTPDEDEHNRVLLRFSRFTGVVAQDDMSGEPVLLTVSTRKQTLLPSEEKKPVAVSDIRYNLPGEATVRVVDSKGALFINKTIPVAQFGVSVALPQDLIKRKPHIRFCTRTGAIQSITE